MTNNKDWGTPMATEESYRHLAREAKRDGLERDRLAPASGPERKWFLDEWRRPLNQTEKLIRLACLQAELERLRK